MSSHLDYCNSLFTCLNQKSMARLQTVQKSAAKPLTRTRKPDRIIPVLASLHWLPVCFRIDFKISRLHGLSPCYISDLLVPYAPVRTLRSSCRGLMSVPEAQLKTRVQNICSQGPEALEWSAQGDQVSWVSDFFKSLLKMYFYRRVFPDFTWVLIFFELSCISFFLPFTTLFWYLFSFKTWWFCELSVLFCCLCEALCNVVFEKCSINKDYYYIIIFQPELDICLQSHLWHRTFTITVNAQITQFSPHLQYMDLLYTHRDTTSAVVPCLQNNNEK